MLLVQLAGVLGGRDAEARFALAWAPGDDEQITWLHSAQKPI